jgi:hypothetical protein
LVEPHSSVEQQAPGQVNFDALEAMMIAGLPGPKST